MIAVAQNPMGNNADPDRKISLYEMLYNIKQDLAKTNKKLGTLTEQFNKIEIEMHYFRSHINVNPSLNES